MKILIALFLISNILFSKVYYAKVEPYEIRNISSSVAGLVLFTDEDMIGEKLTLSPYIKIDDELDTKELLFVQDKLKYSKEIIKVNKKVLINLEKSLEKKRQNYKRIEDLKFKSTVEKDREFYDLVSNENLYLSTQKEIQNLKVQIADLELRAGYLRKNISDKKIRNKNFILYEFFFLFFLVVNISTPLAKIADISKAKLTIYLDEVDVLNSKNKTIYIDGKKTSYKISRTLNIADSKNISKYMAQIIINSPKLFSKLVRVELKDN